MYYKHRERDKIHTYKRSDSFPMGSKCNFIPEKRETRGRLCHANILLTSYLYSKQIHFD